MLKLSLTFPVLFMMDKQSMEVVLLQVKINPCTYVSVGWVRIVQLMEQWRWVPPCNMQTTLTTSRLPALRLTFLLTWNVTQTTGMK